MAGQPTKRPLDFDDYEQLRVIYEFDEGAVRLSPKGTHIAYLVRSPEESESGHALHADLLVIDIDSGETTSVIRGGMASNPSWNPEGTALSFYYKEGESTTVWLWEPGQDQLRQVSKEACLPLGPGSGPIWDPDGKKLYISLSRVSSPSRNGEAEADAEPEPPKDGSTVQVFRSPEPKDDISFPGAESEDKIPELGVIDLITEETSRPCKDFPIGSFRLSANGNWIAVAGPNQWPDKPAWRIVHDIHIVPAAGGKPKLVAAGVESYGLMSRAAYAWSPTASTLGYITDKKAWIYDASTGQERSLDSIEVGRHFLMWSPDGKRIIAFKYAGPNLTDRSNDLVVIPTDGSTESRVLAHSADKGRGMLSDILILGDPRTGVLWSPREQSCAVLTGDRHTKNAEIWEFSFEGGPPSLLWSTDKWISHVKMVDSAGVACCLQDETSPADIWAGLDFNSLKQVTNLNPNLDETARGRGKVISWRDEDGTKSFGYVLLPFGYKEGDVVPVIADIYPGVPGSDVGRRWNAAAGILPPQMLCGRGFAVLIPDLPGVMAAMPDPTKGLAPSLVAGMNELVRLGIADPERLGVMGQSGGGGGVNIVITQTTIFKAAVSAAGIGNWVSFFGQFRTLPDGSPFMYGAGLPSMAYGGPPWEKPLDYVRTSAVFGLGNVSTPLMLIHGTGDTQVGDEQSGEMFAGLHSQGKKAVYLRYPDEGHVPSMFSPANRRDVAARVIEWFEEHLKV